MLQKIVLILIVVINVGLFGTPYRTIVIRHGEKPEEGKFPNIPLYNGLNNPSVGQALSNQGAERSAYLVGYFLGVPVNPFVSPDQEAKDPLFKDLVHPQSPLPYHPITQVISLATQTTKFSYLPPRLPPNYKPPPGPNPFDGTFHPLETITPLANVIFPLYAPNTVDNITPETVAQLWGPLPEPNQDYSEILTWVNAAYNDGGTVVMCWESDRIPYLLIALAGQGHTPPAFDIVKTPTWGQYFKPGSGPDTWEWVESPKPFNNTFVITYADPATGSPAEFNVYLQQESFPGV